MARVYAIELAAGAGRRRDPRIPWVYVGSSARAPEIRFEQHRRGYRSARLVKRFAVRLRPDLYDDLPSYRGSTAAREAEEQRARDLADCGFVAHCDGVSHGARAGAWAEWGPDRLAAVSEHVDAAIGALVESAFEPVSPHVCARLLHGERGFWVGDFLDQDDPPPAYGLFPHVALEALEQRAAALAVPAR